MKQMNLQATPKKGATEITLYHGSPNRVVTPLYGRGADKHDYGKGFYLTPDRELAKEWSVSRGTGHNGWLHTYTLNLEGLKVFDFEAISKNRALCWATEILKHREPNNAIAPYYKQYREFLMKYFRCPTEDYDVVCGWRADDSYFSIINNLMGDTLAIPLLEDALRLGELGIQYCCRSELAFNQLKSVAPSVTVPYDKYYAAFLDRDGRARKAFNTLRQRDENLPWKDNIFMRSIYRP